MQPTPQELTDLTNLLSVAPLSRSSPAGFDASALAKTRGLESPLGSAPALVASIADDVNPTHNVFAVTKRDGEEKGDWFEIGAAWTRQDGQGFNIVLKALPMPGADVVLRKRGVSETFYIQSA
jgi:hypothetical protein